MTIAPPRRTCAGLAFGLMLALAACSGGPKGGARSAGALAAPVRTPLDAAIDLLDQGDEKGALKQIRLLLKTSPHDPSAAVLLESIGHDPVELLGAKSFPYTAQPGDTMLGLSERFLGNRLKFYQLSRYNHLAKPAALAPGAVLRIPGEPPQPAPAAIAEPAPAPPRAPARARPKPKAAAPAAAPAPAPKAPAADPGAALKLRGSGLAALNGGRVADAVRLLRRAAALDPANPLITRDLARAERIDQAVRARR